MVDDSTNIFVVSIQNIMQLGGHADFLCPFILSHVFVLI
jgi:hypothetical protein